MAGGGQALHWRRMRRVTPATVLIVLIFGVASVLAWQAYDAARSHQRSAERLLDDYARFAGWEFARAAQSTFESALRAWGHAGCECDGARALATFRLSGDRLESTGEALPRGAEEWIRRFAAEPPTALPHHSGLRVMPSDRGPRVLVARRGEPHDGAAHAATGFVIDVEPLRKRLRAIVDRRPLLPPTLAGTRNELVAIDVQADDGTPVIIGTQGVPAAARFDGRLDDSFGALRYAIVLEPGAAARLAIGGLPRSRLPLLGGLLALTAALAVAALLQLRREHQLTRLRADFVSSVSHELRTPLAQIRLFSETLLLGRVRTEAEGRRALEIIQQESRRLTHLVDNILFFSRAERGLERVRPAPSSLGTLTSELVEAFQPIARAGRASIRVTVVDATDALVDPEAFRQILLNLLDNAVKYGPAGQTIDVTVERRGAAAVVTVTDKGPGIPPDARSRIWEPYCRLMTASASAVAGTGIGLAVVRRLVDLHGGTVHVEDAPGAGARFVAAFPT
jgi:signal transduction histidine kinase